MICPHEDDITYGKTIDVDEYTHVVHMLCTNCQSVGSMIETRDDEDPEHWNPGNEMWHEPSDYWRSDMAKNMTIKLDYKGE